MPSQAVHTAVTTRLAASWTATPVVDGISLSAPADESSGYVVVQYPVVNGDKPVLHGKFTEEGAIRLVLVGESGTSLSYWLGLADTLATLFREYRPGGGFETFTPSAPIINDANDEGSRQSFAVIVPYRYQFNG